MTITRILLTTALSTLALLGITAPPSTAISQGEPFIAGQKMCTAGYIDQAKGKMYTAAHCLNHVGEEVYSPNYSRIIGRVESMGTTGQWNLGAHDWATVQLYPGNTGGNYTTSNTTGTAVGGDIVCVKSRIMGGKITCGMITDDRGSVITATTLDPSPATYGDSGGEAWSPYKGSIGVISGFGHGIVHISKHPDIYSPQPATPTIHSSASPLEGIQGAVARIQEDAKNFAQLPGIK